MKSSIILLIFILMVYGCNKHNLQTEIKLTQENAKKYLKVKKSYAKRNFSLALKLVNEVISSNDNFVNAHFMKGKILFFTGNLNEAKKSFLYVLKLNPFHIDTLFWLARINSYSKANWNQAERYLKRILFINADNIRANYNLGQLYVKMNKISGAIIRFEKALSVEHNLPYIHYNTGVLYKKLNLIEKAKKHFDIVKTRYNNPDLNAKIKRIMN